MRQLELDRSILYISRSDVTSILDQIDPVSVMFEVFKLHKDRETVLPSEAALYWTNREAEDVRSLSLPGHVGGLFQTAGVKIINGNPKNPSRGMPRASGLVVLFDDESGVPIAIIEGAHISSRRTAAVSALAADFLIASKVSMMAIIGAGALAEEHIMLFVKRYDTLATINIFDVDRGRAEDLATRLQSRITATLRVVESAELAIRSAGLVIPCTTTTTGYIPLDWLDRGTLVIHVSLDDLLPEVVYEADLVFVDDWGLVADDNTRLFGRLSHRGTLSGPAATMNGGRRVDGALADLVVGDVAGRSSEDQIAIFNPFGCAIADVGLATSVYRAAVKMGLGTYLVP